MYAETNAQSSYPGVLEQSRSGLKTSGLHLPYLQSKSLPVALSDTF